MGVNGCMTENRQQGLPAAVWLVPAVALLIALAPLPYGYYTLMRIVVCGAAAFIAYSVYQRQGKVSVWVLVMGGMVLLFNPLIPIHLSREIWAPIDVISALLFCFHLKITRS